VKNSQLIICDREERYVERLADYISRKADSPFIVNVYTNTDCVPEMNGKGCILLISSSLLCEELQQLNTYTTIILNEGNLEKEYSGYLSLMKYQSAEKIYSYLLDIYTERNGALLDRSSVVMKSDTQILGVYSPIGRIGKTEFAIQLGKDMSDKYRVLYMTMEEFSTISSEQEGLSDIIFHFKENKTNIVFKIERSVFKEDGVDFLSPAACIFDVRELTKEEWISFFEELINFSPYERIIIDFGGIPWEIELLNLCTRLYVPFINEEGGLKKLERFEQFLIFMGLEQLPARMIKIEQAIK